MSNRYVSKLFETGEEFEAFLEKVKAFKEGVENGSIVIPKAKNAESAGYATSAGSAGYATSAGSADSAGYATSAGSADSAGYATSAGSAESATNADYATNADSAGYATSAGSADSAGYATSAGSAESATNANHASTADSAKTLSETLPIAKGGTGATDASKARTNLGLGAVATENVLPYKKGGTGLSEIPSAGGVLVAPNSDGFEVSDTLPINVRMKLLNEFAHKNHTHSITRTTYTANRSTTNSLFTISNVTLDDAVYAITIEVPIDSDIIRLVTFILCNHPHTVTNHNSAMAYSYTGVETVYCSYDQNTKGFSFKFTANKDVSSMKVSVMKIIDISN